MPSAVHAWKRSKSGATAAWLSLLLNVMMLPFGLLAIKLEKQILRLPPDADDPDVSASSARSR
jgi:hypothetical protein